MYALAEPRPADLAKVPRDNHWLTVELHRIWETFFADIPRINDIHISFARHWVTRLGLISLSHDNQHTYIGINSLLRHEEVPDFVHVATLAHELVHYAHGFGSPLPRRQRHPHRGGIVVKELNARGLGTEQRACHQWVHDHWREFCSKKIRLLRLA